MSRERRDAAVDLFDDALAHELLSDLERNTSDEIRRQRAHFRIQIKAPLTLRPGNASDLFKYRLAGVTGDLSQGGCLALFSLPVQVGDIYRLEFDRSVLDLPLTFARCVRCMLLREDAYEAGFSFFSAVQLPESLAAARGLA